MSGYQMVGLAILAVLTILADHATDRLDDLRAVMTLAARPVVAVASLPGRGARSLTELLRTRGELELRIREVESELILLQAKMEKMTALAVENDRLRDLLDASRERQRDRVEVAELIGFSPDPEQQEVVIDKGRSDQVFVGQPVVDANGLMGQVTKVGVFSSRVLLASDRAHSVPVLVLRNDLRLIARGTGINQQLELLYVNATADLREGDELVSSGLGGRFPAGYPVGVVDRVEHEPGEPFATVTARPAAQLDRNRYVLLVFADSSRGLAASGAAPEIEPGPLAAGASGRGR